MSGGCTIRTAMPADLDALLALCDEHARYERAESLTIDGDRRARLSALLFGQRPRLQAWIAEEAGDALGYASASAEVSTWAAREYLHLDCLYLREQHRGRGIGAALLRAAIAFARARGYGQLQWQTPEWNLDAARFYLRNGAKESFKRRYALDLAPDPTPIDAVG